MPRTPRSSPGRTGAGCRRCTCRCFAGLTAKLAVGCVRQVVDVSGQTVQSAPPPLPAGTFAGAVFTQPTNIGRRSSNEFAALPELNLRAGCQVCGCLRAFVGYDV